MILRAKHIAYVFFFMLFVILISCTGVKKGGAVDNNKVGIQVEEIQFPPQNILQLKSYYLSSPTHLDSMDILIGYNYRLHSLDYIDLRTKRITQTQLSSDGPDALTRLSGIYAHTLDSVWLSDESQSIFLVDSTGTIKKTVSLRKHLKETEQLLINTNYAMYTSHLYYNAVRQSLMFLVKDLSSNSFGIKEVFVDSERSAITYELSPSKIVPDISEGYTYMDAPNVNFVGENIIYNYPIESSIYTLNILTNENKVITAKSRYTSNLVEKFTLAEDYAALERHRIENPHFYDVMYIPSVKMYARLHIDKLEFDANRDLEKLINDRDLYLMLFNEAFEVVCEVKLAKHRYSYYTGWNVLSDGIALFVDNALDEQNTTDDLRMDLVFPE
ncbi:hypothetical protein [Bacteroides reticulotermitis]|uniref:DUF4221 domain-containing protein n=2 Tax=Bacteroides reticulotermitis TaxID=1133319 RepID=W4UM73_9BACE|nr:hypothetical protein [Bacteroides reticulotermitis]MBB4043232.1 hypothetical protein [Bacteroides reticulotermitis]GAE82046.1 hypothetical protein JCM10512_220 [Bacteroides reticulotermitis JCM 10512]